MANARRTGPTVKTRRLRDETPRVIKIKVVKIQNLSFMMSLGTTDSVMPCRRLHHRAVRCVSTVEEGEWIFFLVLDMRPATEDACEDGDTGDEAAPREDPRAGHRCDRNVEQSRWRVACFLSGPLHRAEAEARERRLLRSRRAVRVHDKRERRGVVPSFVANTAHFDGVLTHFSVRKSISPTRLAFRFGLGKQVSLIHFVLPLFTL